MADTQIESTPALANDIKRLQDELAAVRKNVTWLRDHFQSEVDITDPAQSLFEELEPLPEVEEQNPSTEALPRPPPTPMSASPAEVA